MDALVQSYLALAQEQPVLLTAFLILSCALLALLNFRKLRSVLEFSVKKKRAQKELIQRYAHYQH